MKQTAVEWLEEKLIDSGISFFIEEVEFIQQAKEMEKRQIADAFMVGVRNDKYMFETKEQYYNETFKNK